MRCVHACECDCVCDKVCSATLRAIIAPGAVLIPAWFFSSKAEVNESKI